MNQWSHARARRGLAGPALASLLLHGGALLVLFTAMRHAAVAPTEPARLQLRLLPPAARADDEGRAAPQVQFPAAANAMRREAPRPRRAPGAASRGDEQKPSAASAGASAIDAAPALAQTPPALDPASIDRRGRGGRAGQMPAVKRAGRRQTGQSAPDCGTRCTWVAS